MWSSRQWLFALKASVTALVAIHALLALVSFRPFGVAATVSLWKSRQESVRTEGNTLASPAEGALKRRGGESNAPLRAALHDSLAQRNQLWALMSGNASLAPGWSLVSLATCFELCSSVALLTLDHRSETRPSSDAEPVSASLHERLDGWHLTALV